MEIRPIRSESDYDQALQRVNALWNCSPGSRQEDEMDVWVTLIEAYEQEHYPIDLPSALEAIEFRLEQSGKTYKDLIGIIGQRTRVYEVMRGARPLSLRMIRKLYERLQVPADVLIQPAKRRPQRSATSRASSSRASRQSRKRA